MNNMCRYRYSFHAFVCSLSVFASLSCVQRKFQSSVKDVNQTASASPKSVTKNYGGPLNFGIPFAATDESIANRFWGSWKDKTQYATRTIESLGNLSSDLSNETFYAEINNPAVTAQILKLTQAWFAGAGKWAQLGCQRVDMEEVMEGRFKPGQAMSLKRGEESCVLNDKSGNRLPSEAGWSQESLWGFSANRKVRANFRDRSETAGEMDVGVAVLFDEKIPGGFVVQATPGIKWKDQYGVTNTYIELYVVGNYVIPGHGWSVSKAFATPVLEFEGDSKSPNFLKPKAWYDLGMLILHGLPSTGNILVSRTGETLATAFSDPESKQTIGFLGHKFPAERLNTFVKPEEALGKDFMSDKNMERMPIGSMHFIANAAWAQSGRGLTRYIYVKDVTRDELIALYSASDKKSGSVWVNALDRVNFSGKPPNAKEVNQALVGGDCGIMEKNTGIAQGLFLEAEIILGMERGRELLLSNRAGLSTCEKRDKRD